MIPRSGCIRFRRLAHNPDLPLPARASPHAAGYDIRSAEEAFDLLPGEIRAVGTGLALELPEGMECQVRPRSGLALRHGLTIPNAPGTIDADYRGEIRVILMNLADRPIPIARGERIAQLVFARFEVPELVEADELSRSERGARGFGSTGQD